MTLRRLRLIAFLGFLLLVAASVAVTFAALQTQRDDALVINLAGRQRMLIQKMTLEVLGVQVGANPAYYEDLHDTAHDHFEQTLNALIAGGPAPYAGGSTVTLPPAPNPEILAQLETVRATWAEMHAAIHGVLENDPASPAFAESVAAVEQLSPAILAQMDEAVRLYEAEAERKVAWAQAIQIGFLAAAVVLLVVVLVGTDRRVLNPIARLTAAARRIGEGDLATPVSVAGPREIDWLARSFDDMRQSLAASRAELEAGAERLAERVRQRTEQLSALHEITALVGGSPDVDQMLKAAVDKVSEVMEIEAAAALLLDETAGELRLTTHRGLSARFAREAERFKLGQGLSGRVAASGEPVVVSNVADDPRLEHSVAREEGWRAFASVPLLSRGQVLGVFNVATRQERAFPAEEVAVLSAIGRVLGVAIENARLHDQVKAQRIEEQTALLHLSQALLGESEPHAIMNLAVQAAATALGVEFADLALMDPGGESYSDLAGVGWPPEILRQTRQTPLSTQDGVSYAIHARSPVIVPDESKETRFSTPGWVAQMGIVSSLIVPMLAGGEAIGALNINSRPQRDWTGDEVRLLSLIANNTAQALDRARQHAHAVERLERISALHDIDVAITSPLGLQATLDVLLEKVTERLRVDAAAVALATAVAFIDPKTRKLVYAAKRGLNGEFFVDGLLKVKEGIAGQVAHSGEVAAVPDVKAEPGFVRAAIAERLGLVSYLAVPLQARGEILGVLELATRQRHDFLPEEIDFFVTLAGQAAIVIDNSRMYEQAVRRAAQQRALAESAGGILVTLEAEALWPAVTAAARQILAADRAAIYLYHADTDRLTCPHASGLSAEYVAEINRRFRQIPGGQLLSDPRPVVIADARTDPAAAAIRDLATREGFRSYAVFPLLAPRAAPDAFVVYRNKVAPFSPDDITAGQTLAHIAAVALQNGRLLEAERAARKQAETLRGATQALSATLDLQQVFDVILSELQQVVPYDSASVQQLKGERLEIIGGHGFPNLPELLGVSFDMTASDNPNGEVIRTRAPLVLEDAPTIYPEFRRGPHAAAGIRSWLGAPLLFGDRLIGMIALDKQEPGFYTGEHALLALAFAAHAAVAIENARLFDETRRRAEELEALAAVSAALRQARTRADMLPLLVETAMRTLRADAGTLALLEEESVVFTAARGPGEALLGQGHPPRDDPLWQVVRAGQPLFIADVSEHGEFAQGEVGRALMAGMTACACVPLQTAEATVGLLHLAWRSRREVTEQEKRLLTAIAEMAGSAIHRATLHEQTERSVQRLTALHTIDTTITASFDLRLTLNVLLDQVTTHLGVDAADVLLLSVHTQTLEYAAGHGFRTNAIARARLRLNEGHAGRVVLERCTVHIPNLPESGPAFARTQLLAGENFIAYSGAPLIAKGQIKGVLELFHRKPIHPDPEWLEFFETLAGQAAIAIEDAQLFGSLHRSHDDLAMAYDATIEGWSRALDLRDKETEGHTQRVTELTLRLAREMGIDDAELVHIRRGALLHDIGKMGIPDSILLKPGPLSDEEWVIMKKHPAFAFDMLSPIAYLQHALDIPYYHHEKWDGAGYPRGLKGERIPLAARIFAVVDVYDALRSDRPYRPGWSEEKALDYIREQAGKHFDPAVVKIFLETLAVAATLRS